MPRLARFRIAALEDLHRQLQFAPPQTRRRQMDAAERLVDDIDPAGTYPQDFIIFRITGYRPDQVEEAPLTFVGEALIGDLVNLVQRLSGSMKLAPDDAGRHALTMDEVAQRLKVSIKTLQRYRRRGLVCHYVQIPEAVGHRLACFEDALGRFMDRHHAQLRRAATFSRVAETVEQKVVEEARRICRDENLSLNETARRLARRHRRAHETIRGILRRHDRRADEPIFVEHGPLTDRDARLIHRAWRRGIAAAELAGHFGKSVPTIGRVLNRRRCQLLSRLDIRALKLPTFELEDAESVILSAPAVAGGLDELLPVDDVLAMSEAAHDAPVVEEDLEAALLAGYNLLKRRAADVLAGAERRRAAPSETTVDRIETDLRWASMLKRRLVTLGMPQAIRRIEQNLHRPLITQPADRIVALIALAIDVIGLTVETLDPSQGWRLERRVAYAMDRALAAPGFASEDEAEPLRAGRAAARHEPGAIRMTHALRDVTPWADLLDLRRDLMPLVERLEDGAAEIVRRRYGLGAAPPLTLAALAERCELPMRKTAGLLRDAERELRERARARME